MFLMSACMLTYFVSINHCNMQSQNFTEYEIWHGPSKGARTREVGVGKALFASHCVPWAHIYFDLRITVSQFQSFLSTVA